MPPARSPGFHWYVAWRYLMARPRRLSGIILVFAAVFAWVDLADAFSAVIVPVTDSYIAAGIPLPFWFALALGGALAIPPATLVYGAVREAFFSDGKMAKTTAIAAVVLLLAGVVINAVGIVQAVEHNELPMTVPIGGMVLLVAAGLVVVRRPGALSSNMLLAIGVGALMSVGVIVYLMLFEDAELVWLVIEEGGSPFWRAPLVLAAPVTALGAFAVGAATRRRAFLRAAVVAAALIPAGLAAEVWFRLAAYGFAEVMNPNSAIDFRAPVFLIIPAALGGTLLLWSLLLLAIRYLFTFFTTVSIGGVAIGTMALVITLSVMSGFENDLREKILGSNAHVLVSREDEQSFGDYQSMMARFRDTPGVVAMTPYLSSEVVIAGTSNYFNVVIKGVDPRTIARVTDLGEDLEDVESLERLYPLDEEGKVVTPPDAGPPPAAPPDAGAGPPAVDPAPGDMNVGEVAPDDWSGGETRSPEPPPEPDAGVADAGPGSETGTKEQDISVEDIGPPAGRELLPEVANLPGVLVGRELVKQISLYVGQEVRVISPLGQNTLAGQTPYIKPYRVAGVFFTGMYEYDLKLIYVELGTLQDFLDVPDVITGVEIRVSDPEDTDAVVKSLRALVGPGFRIQDWKELNRSLFSALKLEKIAMFLVLAIIILVASFSIVGNLIMVVVEKAREIAVLKTLGASDSGVTRIFIVQGLLIGLVGTAIGVSLGLGVCYIADRFGIGIPPDVYYIDRLPIHVDLMSVAQVAAAGILISIAATIYPAQIAARLRPVEGLRYE